MSEAADRGVRRRLKATFVELAAMLKEVQKGTLDKLEEVKAKFCLQEGVKENRADEYLEILKKARLLIISSGNKTWTYNKEAEWELFNTNI